MKKNDNTINKKKLKINKKNLLWLLAGAGIILVIIGIIIAFTMASKNNKLCEIKFDTAGGNKVDSIEFKCGKEIIEKPNNPEKEGFKFLGWQLNGVDYNFDNPIDSSSILVAIWEADGTTETVRVVFNTVGADEIADIELIKGSKLNRPEDPKKEGYKFIGWYLDDAEFDFDTEINEDIELKAKWEKVDENGYAISTQNACSGYVGKSQTIEMEQNVSNQINLLFNMGLSYNENCKITYKSSNSSIVSINNSGKVQTNSNEGSATIYACLTDKKTGADYDCFKGIVNVRKKNGDSIDDTPKNIYCYGNAYINENSILNVGSSSGDFAKYYDSIESSNPDVVQVVDSNNLTIRGLKSGNSTITLKMKNGDSTTCSVDSSEKIVYVKSVEITNCPKTMYKGDKLKLNVRYNPPNIKLSEDMWSTNSNILQYDQSGNFKAVGTGQATIEYAAYAPNVVRTTCTINVLSVPISSMTINKTHFDMFVGDTEFVSVTVLPSNADTELMSWKSSNLNVVKISGNQLIAVGPGTATITVTDFGKTFSATATVTVKAIPVSNISLNKNSLTLTRGTSEKLTASISPTNATNKNVTWTSSNPSVASVDQSGNVNAVGNGTATITATADGQNASATVTVVSPSLTGKANVGYTTSVTSSGVVSGISVELTPSGGSGSYTYYYIELYKNGNLLQSWEGSKLFVPNHKNGTYYAKFTIKDSEGNVYNGTSFETTVNIGF